MMKKKFLIASLLLAASTFGAEETKWDFTGSNVEANIILSNSQKDAIYAGKDEDLILKVSKKVDDKTTVSFKYDTDDSNPDFKVEAVVNRKFNEFLEAQIDLDLITGDNSSTTVVTGATTTGGAITAVTTGTVNSTKGTRIEEDYDSDKVFIKYTPNNKLAIKFNPFDIDLTVGDFFETSGEQKTPGLQAEYKLSNAINVYAGVGTGKYDSGTSLENIKDKLEKETTVYGIKAGATYKQNNTFIKVALGMNTQDDEDITPLTASPLKMATDIMVEQKIGKFTINGEAIVTQVNKANKNINGITTGLPGLTDSEVGKAMYAKVKYAIGNNTPYVKGIYADKYAYFDDGDYSATLKDSSVLKHGGLTALEVGDEYALKGGVKVIPYVEIKNTENKIFKDKDGNSNKKDQSVLATVKVKLTF